MDRKTARSAAAALAMTSAAAVSALFLTVGQPAQVTTPEPAPVVRTDYEIVRVEPDAAETTNGTPAVAERAREVVVHEIEYVQAEPFAETSTYAEQDHDDYSDDRYGDDDDSSNDDQSEGDDD